MKKRIIAFVVSLAVSFACLTGGASAAAQLSSHSISVNTGIKIYVNGREFVPADSESAPVAVFIYNGTTYLPVRAISGLFGTGVEWDNETKSVYLGSRDGVSLPKYSDLAGVNTSPFTFGRENITVFTGVEIYYNGVRFEPTGSDGENVDVFLYNGTTYLPVRAISSLFAAQIDWDQQSKAVMLTTAESKTAEAASLMAKKFSDMDTVLLPQYQYYLKVLEVLDGYSQELKAAYLMEPDNIELQYLFEEFMAAYAAFVRQFGTYMDNAMSLYEFSKTLSERVENYAEGGYSAEELEMLAANTGYLADNQKYYSEYIQNTTAEHILNFVGSAFSPEVLELVGRLT